MGLTHLKTLRAVIALGSLLMLASCRAPASSKLPAESPLEDARLGPGDVFEIRVFGEEKLSGSFQVGPDGAIQFPFLGVLAVGGQESNQVASAVREGLIARDIIRDPHVSVLVKESNSRRISVLGAVSKPGTFPIIPGITVIQAVSNAGGFTPLASKDDTVVTRRVNGKLERYRVAVSQVSRGNQDDFRLSAGDIVFVPERVF